MRQPFIAAALLVAGSAHAAGVGDPIDEAIAVHLTNRGLASMGDVVEALVPGTIPVDSFSGETVCSEDDTDPLSFSLDGIDLLLEADEVALVAREGRLDMTLYATLNSSEATLVVNGDCSILADLDEECGVDLPTTALTFHLGLVIEEREGAFDVTVDATELNISPIGNPLSDCTLASGIGALLGQDEQFITSILTGLVEPSLADLGPTVEEALEGVLNGLTFDTSFDAAGVIVDLSLYPSLVELGEAGIVLGLGAAVDVPEVSDCVDSSAGSTLTGAGWPDFGAEAAGTSLEHDLGLYVGKDFADHLLYTLWAGGLLCVDVGNFIEGGISAGVLGGVLGEHYKDLFPEDTPTTLTTSPDLPPTVEFSHDSPPLRMKLEQLGLVLSHPLDDREVRVFRVDTEAQLGVNVAFGALPGDTADTGALGEGLVTGVVFDEDDLRFTETYNELLPAGFSQGLYPLVETALGSLLPDDLLPSIALPSLLGAGVDSLVWLPTDDGAWQGGFVMLDTSGVEPLAISGCSMDGLGCGGEGTGTDLDLTALLGCSDDSLGCGAEGGCSAGSPVVRGVRGRLVLVLVLLGGVLARRRRGAVER